MKLRRNPEIRRYGYWYGLLAAGMSAAGGFFFGLPAALYILAVCAACAAVFWKAAVKRYEAISDCAAQLNGLLHSREPLHFVPDEEGELAVLTSEIQKLTVQLSEQAEQSRKDKEYLKDFIADISHQIRTPLTSLRMIAPRLGKEGLTSKQREEYVGEMHRLLGRMEWQITVLLKIARLESGTIQMENVRVSLKEIVMEALSPLEIPMEIKQISVSTDVDEDAEFFGDKGWMTEAVSNILKNSLEHLPQGGKLQITGKRNPIFAELCIRDNGKGVAPEELPHLFERFYKGKNAPAEGAGIGLALAQMIIRKQNGVISARNLSPGGLEFQIRFYKIKRERPSCQVTDLS